jgi:alkaline phosphatase D
VASGDPQPHGIALWTRLDPKTARRGSNQRGRVAYEISRDENFGDVVLRGVVETSGDRDYTVKTQLSYQQELDPFTTYYYRFVHQQTVSRTGRFKTLPAQDQALDLLRFGYTSCQDYTNGYYHALRRLAGEDLDYVVHLGD